MSHTVANLRDSVSGILQGLNLDTVSNLNGCFERTARLLCQKIDMLEATGTEQLDCYAGVYDYPAPESLFGTEILDLQPQGVTRNASEFTYKIPLEQFDREKAYQQTGASVTFQYNKGTPILRISEVRSTQEIIFDSFNATTGWTAGGDASSLTLDSTVYYQYSGSLRFNLAASGSNGYIEKTISTQDLTNYVGVGVVFVAVRLPSATAITSIGVRLGSSSSNYYSVSNTEGFLGAFVAGEWLLVALDLADATQTGTVTPTAVDYLRIFVNYDGTALSNVYIGGCWISLPTPYTLIYGTSAIFQASGSNPSQTITTSADLVLLNDAAYVIYEHECALAVALQQGGRLSGGLITTLNSILYGNRTGAQAQPGLYDLYRADNPSQELRTVGNWY